MCVIYIYLIFIIIYENHIKHGDVCLEVFVIHSLMSFTYFYYNKFIFFVIKRVVIMTC